MKQQKKDWIECISYGWIGLFSLSLFVFGAMFPKYMFVEESFGNRRNACGQTYEPAQIMSLEDLRKREIKVTCLSYECLKEIIDGWD
ncbi:MAG: hypothetical protein IJ711_07275 [Lachnospiraceae bacterium]|nr:hypothetical protein [Lachnospiraceae bacterium]